MEARAQVILDGLGRSLKFGFRFHRYNLWNKRVIQIIHNTSFFLFFWIKLFCSWSQKLVDVGTGAKKCRCQSQSLKFEA